MSKEESPPFPRGSTFYDGATIDSANLGGVDLEGREWVFEDLDLTTAGAKAHRTNFQVRCRIVRNSSGVTIVPNRVVTYQSTNWGKRIDGMCDLLSENAAGVVDEWLPTAGVVANDLFWIVVEGPAMCNTTGAAITETINVGDWVVAASAAASTGGTLAGRIQSQLSNAATLPLINQVQNRLGRAMTARTADNTNSNTLVYIKHL